jgi:hypothetical protein
MHVDEALLVRLRDPATPAEELAAAWYQVAHKWLRNHLSLELLGVSQYIAVNPNTPAEILNRVIEYCPVQVLKNPVLPLLALENPRLDCFTYSHLCMLLAASDGEYTHVVDIIRRAIADRHVAVPEPDVSQWKLTLQSVPAADLQKLKEEILKMAQDNRATPSSARRSSSHQR